MTLKTRFLIFVISVFSSISQAEIYKCLTNSHETKYQNSPCVGNVQSENKVNVPIIEHKQTTIKQIQGHYFMTGEINGIKSPFLVDTGASLIALPQSFADKAKIACSGDFIKIGTANGEIMACVAKLEKLSLTPFEFQNVDAVIHPNLDIPLLGMNVLQKFNIEQRNGEMHLFEK